MSEPWAVFICAAFSCTIRLAMLVIQISNYVEFLIKISYNGNSDDDDCNRFVLLFVLSHLCVCVCVLLIVHEAWAW